MKMPLRFLAVVVAAGSLQTVSAANITGKITLEGDPPPERPIIMTDANCARIHVGKQITTQHYVVGGDKGLGNVFVYLKEGVTGEYEPPEEQPVLDQVDCIYTPYMMGVMSGQTFLVKNSDPLFHNVNTQANTFSDPRNKGFNIAQINKGMNTREVQYYGRELFVQFRCDVHPWMFGYVGVVEHPFFAVTDKDGNFTIKDVPPGEYTIEIRHLRAGEQTRKVKVGEEDVTENFTLQAK